MRVSSAPPVTFCYISITDGNGREDQGRRARDGHSGKKTGTRSISPGIAPNARFREYGG